MSRRRRLFAWLRRSAPLEGPAAEAIARETADGRVRDQELRAQIARAIDALSPKLRDALLLMQSGEYTQDEIGAMLRIPVGTVKWRVSEARRKVRARLAAMGYMDA